MTGSVEEIIISTLKPKCLICLIHYQSSDLKVDAETLGISIPKRRCSLSPHGCSTLRPRNKKYAPERVAQRILLRSVCRVRQKRCARPPACGPPAVALDACGGPALVRPGRNGRRFGGPARRRTGAGLQAIRAPDRCAHIRATRAVSARAPPGPRCRRRLTTASRARIGELGLDKRALTARARPSACADNRAQITVRR